MVRSGRQLLMHCPLESTLGNASDFSIPARPWLVGERQQVHLLGPDQSIKYFSRRGIDHGPDLPTGGGGRFSVFDPVVRGQVSRWWCPNGLSVQLLC